MNQELTAAFESVFNRRPSVAVRAPGRVNLIGEHTDYNDGFVLPIAIERQVTALIAPCDGRTVRFASCQQDAPVELDLDADIVPGEPKWANYCRGVAAGLLQCGVTLSGADILFDSTVPIGGGLSSSAALEVATALALMTAAGTPDAVGGPELAKLCQQAEHTFAGAPCGIMDQSISIMACAGHALLLDCRDNATRQIPFDDPDVVLLVADTKVQHAIGDGGYAARRQQCEQAAEKLGVPALRDADTAMIKKAAETGTLTDVELMRARHVVDEIARTLSAADALTADDIATFGALMYQSHASLRDDYQVSCDELDAVVELARPLAGVYGARMTGGGFGGCAIILAAADKAETVAQTVREGFAGRFGHECPIFATRAAAGAGSL